MKDSDQKGESPMRATSTLQTVQEQGANYRLDHESPEWISLQATKIRLSTIQDLTVGLQELLNSALVLLRADMGNIQLLDPIKGELRIAVSSGFKSDFLEFFSTVRSNDDSACGRAYRVSGRVVIYNVDTDSRFSAYREIARKAGFKSVQSSPIKFSEGPIYGILSTHYRVPTVLSHRDLEVLDVLVELGAEFIQRVK